MDYVIEIEIECPYCASTADTSQSSYATIEDCSVCCRPIAVEIACEPGEVISISSSRA
jgi:hypothetical protein